MIAPDAGGDVGAGVTAGPGPAATVVAHRDLRIGPLLAEGGEGRVFELVDQRGTLLKDYRRPAALAPLVGLVEWPRAVAARSPELARRVAAAAAWPSAVVVDGSPAAGDIHRDAVPRDAGQRAAGRDAVPRDAGRKATDRDAVDRDGIRRGGAGRNDQPGAARRDFRPDGSRLDGSRADGLRAGGSRLDGLQGDGSRLDGSRADGLRADGSCLDGSRLDGTRADGLRADGSRLDGLRRDEARPAGTVRGAGLGRATGLLLPRAPRRFSVRHRGGDTHLATLSYLTAPPEQRAASYGLTLPPPFSVDRLGIVYALARLLEALQSATPSVGHGDLSTKNVLWSLERGPEVFVLDCDSAERYAADGSLLDVEHRRRAMTPNWDDPAIPPGSNPTPESDRYSLALIFLRVTAAAHFPIQGRQRRGEPLHIDFEVPPWALRARSLDADAPIWDLCERGLGVARPGERPPAASWAAALEQILDDLGAMRTVRAVWAAQGGGHPGPTPAAPRAADQRDPAVRVRPVIAAPRSQAWRRVTATLVPSTVPTGSWRSPVTPVAPVGPTAMVAVPAPSIASELRAGLRRALAAWLAVHRRMLRSLATRGSRGVGVARLLACGALDLFLALWITFLLGVFAAAFLKL